MVLFHDPVLSLPTLISRRTHFANGETTIFYTIDKAVVAETEEKRSRFIAHLVPIDAFEETLAELRYIHKKANHHVTAFRTLNDENQIVEGAKDDGEPAGTSGMPILKVLIGSNLIHVGIIVVRYFGGVKLGTGGLARAYGGAAQTAIRSATLVEWQPIEVTNISASFSETAKIEHAITLSGVSVVERQFNEAGVTFTLEGTAIQVAAFHKQMAP